MQRAVGDLTKTSLTRMEREMPWVAELPAEHRAWIGMVLQAGFTSFITWYRTPDQPAPPLTVEVFGNAPRSFAGVISLQQTVAMIRVSIEVAESDLTAAVSPEHQEEVRMSILRYGRELAFATADVYAHAAETRGAWDARLEALVVDSVVRGDADETVRSRASALGWIDAGNVAVLVGRAPESRADGSEGIVDLVRTSAKDAGLDALGAVHGDRLVVVVGGVSDADKAGALLLKHFGDGPVVVGPVVPDLLQAHVSAAQAVAGLRAAVGWPSTPALVTSEDLLAERALDGDLLARNSLVVDVYSPLHAAGSETLETLTAFLDQGGSIEGTARILFVHPNTVRYRLRRVLDLTGLAPNDARHAFTLRIALVLGRLGPPDHPQAL
jgi:DNA-binding PucR family transcriptional regulator